MRRENLLLLAAVAMCASTATVRAFERDEPITPIPGPPNIAPAKLALGGMLFRDRRLSQSETVSCNSCHDLARNGASGRREDPAQSGAPLQMNTLTVFNATLNYRYNWQGQRATLEQFTDHVLGDATLMGAGKDIAVARLRRDPEMVKRFGAVYKRPIDRMAIVDALAAFERSLVTPGSRFDAWLGGDEQAMSVQEKHGYARFKALGCISCHQGVNLGGNLMQRHGIFHQIGSKYPELLRVPSLRNVAVTAPYFHDGSARTLAAAVRLMGWAQLDQRLPDRDVDDIVAFLGALTGKFRGKALRAPDRAGRR